MKINAVLINKNEYLISFDFQPNDLNLRENIGKGTTINTLITTITTARFTVLNSI